MMKLRNTLKKTPGRARVTMLIAILALLFVGTFALAADLKPSRTSTVGSHAQLRGCSPCFQNYVQDTPYYWIPFTPVHFAVSSSDDITSTVVGAGGGTPTMAEINTSEITGFTTDADAESVSVMMPFPADCDKSQAMYVRALWSNSESAATGTLAIDLTYAILTAGTTAVGAATTTTGVTDAAAVADAAANVVKWTGWSTIAASTFSANTAEDIIIWKVAVDLTTIADATLYGIQLKCSRKWLGGD